MLTILVINSKGGSGKTTLTTNLAGYYASKKLKTAIMDYDPQGSSLHWLATRPRELPNIHGANAAPAKGNAHLGSRQNWVPLDTEVLVIDAPAGTGGLLLKELVRKANYILIPVAPSPIDIHASADFIKDLFLVGGARTSKAKIAVVANRVRSRTAPVYATLERFLNSLKMPFLTSIGDSDIYLQAIEKGMGVFEMEEQMTASERQELMPILKWLEGHFPNRFGVRADDKVVSLESSRKWAVLRQGAATGRFPALRSGES
ncbi:MAG TPA: AAA family ATPase [Sideroxyarcus sp.]|nr:AAA family ATPase [Sideroxyarcus sp.]